MVKKHVLIVDDDPDIVEAMRLILEAHEYDVDVGWKYGRWARGRIKNQTGRHNSRCHDGNGYRWVSFCVYPSEC